VSREFTAAERLYVANPVPGSASAAWSVSVWFYPDSQHVATICMIQDDDANAHYEAIYIINDGTIRAQVADGGASGRADSVNTYSASAWNHAFASFISTTSRKVQLNGGTMYTNTTSKSPAGIDVLTIGGRNAAPDDGLFDGKLAEIGIWDTELTTAEAFILSKGVSPLLVRPGNLVAYYPFVGGTLNDRAASNALTDTGTTTAAAHSPAMRPAPFAPTPSPAKGKIWVNDAASWDAGAVQQTHPGTGWTDTSIAVG
jgi:hypothetical protein